MSTQLSPCPICKSEAELEYYDYNENSELGDDGTGEIKCLNPDCRLRLFFDDAEQSIERWNKLFNSSSP